MGNTTGNYFPLNSIFLINNCPGGESLKYEISKKSSTLGILSFLACYFKPDEKNNPPLFIGFRTYSPDINRKPVVI